MTRRELVKKGTVLGLAATIPASSAWAYPASKINAKGFFEFNVGELQLLVVSDGSLMFDPVQPTFAPGISSEDVKRVLAANCVPTDYLDLGVNILVVKKKGQVILFDTGCGHLYGPTGGKLVSSLSAAGIAPDEVTDIILTHAHGDHVGGLVDADYRLVFPAAKIYMSKLEYAFWTDKNPDFTRSKVSVTKAESMVKTAQKILGLIENELRFFSPGERLFGCMEMELAPGHTPGHTVTRIYSGDEELIHLADISHSHTLLLAHPEWGNSFDYDFVEANETRRKMLSRIVARRQRVFSYHFPWPGIGFIRKKEAGFEWVPQAFSSPYFADSRKK